MSLIVTIICSLIFLLWIVWLCKTYPEIQKSKSKDQNPYSFGASILLLITIILSVAFAKMTAVLQIPEISQTTFVLTLFLGFIAIFIHHVYASRSKKAFQKTLITGALFSVFILVLEAVCFFVYGVHR